MKLKITLLLLACFAIASCTKWHYGNGGHHDDDDPGDKITYEDIKVDESVETGKPEILFSPNEVIVKYPPGTSDIEKNKIKDDIKNEFSNFQHKECDCGDTNMELWIFDGNADGLNIEGVVDRLSRGRPTPRGERSFDIQLTPIDNFIGQGQGVDGDEAPLIVKVDANIPAKINIAIIDTGLDFYRYLGAEIPKRFLFPSEAFGSCYHTDSGWNFTVDPGNGAFADSNGHGTYITKIITDELDDKNLDYRILPLKVFNGEGKGSYWDVLCALSYVKQLNEHGANINIVNASFGGGMPREIFKEPEGDEPRNIYAEILDDLNNAGTLVITSAGNKGEDNDFGPEGDFISSFEAKNILSVGGYEYDTINPAARPIKIHPDSNFGSKGSVDIALAYNDYKIIFDTGDPNFKQRVTLQGTSYAAAAMSGMAGSVIDEVGRVSPENLREFILKLAIEDAPLLEGKIAEKRVIPRAPRAEE